RSTWATRRTTASSSRRSWGSRARMRWTIEDTPERAAFREEVRGWLRENLPTGWADAIESGDADALDKARQGWDFLGWSRTIGMSGYGAPLWPKEYGGLSGEPWMQNIVREE